MAAIHSLINTDIARPARYLGNELGAVHKDWHAATVRWVLTYPEIYEVGSSNLGHIILYSILNRQPRQLCDRAYLPGPDLADKLKTTQTPLFAVESQRALTEFDILGFSLSYELGATNILEMLSLAGIPLTWQARQATSAWNVEDGSWPLIFAGGQTATSNPEPYADFFDFIALGDGEELLPEIGLVIEEGKAAGLSREALLLDLAQVPGVYVPQFYTMTESGAVVPTRPDVPARVLRRVAPPMPDYSIGLVPHIQTVHDRLTIEIRRGCTRGCRFCQPGMLTRPARDVEPEQVVDAIERGMRATGYNEFSLLSLSCSDYLALPAVGVEVKNRLKDSNISLSLPSQRVDRFDENIAHIVGGTRQTGLTFAPEAGTQRMRDIINKGLTNEELLRGVRTAYEQGWNRVKLYFMIGLPGETDVDVVGIAETVRWLRQECRLSGRKPLGFNITISNFTPKPHTPFQWHAVSTAEFERKQALLQDEFRQMRGIKVNFTDVRISAMEDFVGRGDRRLSSVVRRAWELGAGMDAWWESLEKAYNAWTQAIEDAGLTWKYRQTEWGVFDTAADATTDFANLELSESGESETIENILSDDTSLENNASEGSSLENNIPENNIPENTISENTISENTISENNPPKDNSPEKTTDDSRLQAPLPWEHIDTGIDKQWLIDDLQRALAAATVPDCSFEGCSHCGICGPEFGHNVVVPPPPVPNFEGHFQPNQTRMQRLRVRLGKQGSMALLGHLDLARMLDRAVRRAALPIAFTGGFHPGPRIIPANALPLGATSEGELIDFELTQSMDPAAFAEALRSQLPDELPLYDVAPVALTAPAATKLLDRAEYLVVLQAPEASPDWSTWTQQVLDIDEIWFEKKQKKSGKIRRINLRERLFTLDFLGTGQALANQATPDDLPTAIQTALAQPNTALFHYLGSCRNDGTLLRPEQIAFMFEQATSISVQLVHIHRQRLLLACETGTEPSAA